MPEHDFQGIHPWSVGRVQGGPSTKYPHCLRDTNSIEERHPVWIVAANQCLNFQKNMIKSLSWFVAFSTILMGVRTLKFPMALKWPKTSPSQILLRVQKIPIKKSAMERILNSLLLTLAYVAIYTNKIT